MIALAK